MSIFIYMSHSKPAKPCQGLRSPDFFHFFITFRNDVMRSFLRFIIGLREVLPHDADAEQLNRADEDDHTHEDAQPATGSPKHRRRTMMTTSMIDSTNAIPIPDQDAMLSGTSEKLMMPSNAYFSSLYPE